MTLLVDTSVWSSALRHDIPEETPEVAALRRALAGADLVVTTGLIIQELLQGFTRDESRALIVERFSSLTVVHPDLDDHIAAATLRTICRRVGVQLGTVDALIARLAIRHRCTLLTADRDFAHAAPHIDLRLWAAAN